MAADAAVRRQRELAATWGLAAFALLAGALLLALPALGFREPGLGFVSLLVGTAVQIVAGAPFYLGVRSAVAARAANVDTLVVVGTTAAWIFGAIEVLSTESLVPGGQQYYFDVAALALGFLLAGRAFERRMQRVGTVRGLERLRPATARVVQGNAEVEVAAASVKPGTIVVVRADERIPVDGLVVDGEGAVDEKMLTGESLPVDKGYGDRVIAGSVNRGGELRVQATEAGAETALAKIIQLVEEAQAVQTRRFADKTTAWFVPLVLVLAVAVFAVWAVVLNAPLSRSFGILVAVLLIACPAAVSFATPAALSIGVSRGAGRGILLKGADALERIQKVDMVVFDKTGTLTKGDPVLTDIKTFGVDEPSLLRLSACAEAKNQHPLAKTIVQTARERKLKLAEPEKARALPGAGVEAVVDGEEILVGNPRMFSQYRVDFKAAEADLSRLAQEGKTVVFVARNGKLAGLLALSDPIRTEAHEAIAELRKLGIDVALVTGDNARTAEAVAGKLGIRRIFAEITPHGKSACVKALQEGDHVVAMVGDGINDAPALAAADIGIAIAAGSDVAIEAAHIVLVRNDPRDVPEAIDIGRHTFSAIKQNLFWAFVYNVGLVPVAALGLLSPLFAGLANAAGSATVAANSRRIARQER